MKKTLLLMILVVALVGCANASNAHYTNLMNNYRGQNIDKFMINNGPPTAKTELHSGDVMYTWDRRNTHKMQMPNTVAPGTATAFVGGQVATVNYTQQVPGQTVETHAVCVTKVITDPKGTIKDWSSDGGMCLAHAPGETSTDGAGWVFK